MYPKTLITVITLLLVFAHAHGQIPAASQNVRVASWVAMGVDQQLHNNWSIATRAGIGMQGNPQSNHSLNLMYRRGVFVAKQTLTYKYKTWFATAGVGYWRKNVYQKTLPFSEMPTPLSFRNELRSFYMFGGAQHIAAFTLKHTLRPEFRWFYNQDMSNRWSTPFEFRLRYSLACTVPLTRHATNSIILINEVFSAVDKYGPETATIRNNAKWSAYKLTEDRFSLFYRHSFSLHKYDVDIGIMNQYWREKINESSFSCSNTFMVDFIAHNIFAVK